jgi:hypothetical protein
MRRRTQTDLERRLRDDRPEPGEDFVAMLAARIEPVGGRRSSITPRIAAVLAATAALTASLGVAGALGSASGSVQAFGRGVFHLVQPSRSVSPAGAAGSPARQPGGSDPSFGFGRVGELPPFGREFGGTYPICRHGQIISVHWWQLFWFFLHGATSARSCLPQSP